MKEIIVDKKVEFLNPFIGQLAQLNGLRSPFSLPTLPYPTNTLLSVAMDEETIVIHHDKHHQSYVTNLNKAIGDNHSSLLDIFKNASTRPVAVRNNAGGHWNHSLFWTILSGVPGDNKIPSELKKEIQKEFGSVSEFKKLFEQAGTSVFGSGWVWLVINYRGKLQITTTDNQDNPLMDNAAVRGVPILALDVWEHAYYLKFKNERKTFLKNCWKIINWKQVYAYWLEAGNINI
jgi:Fe-Mn family superoxide dismutase